MTPNHIPERNVRVLQPNKTFRYLLVALFFMIVALLGCADMLFWWKWSRIAADDNLTIKVNLVLSSARVALGLISGILCLMTISYANSTIAASALVFQLVHTIAIFCHALGMACFIWISPPDGIIIDDKEVFLPVNIKIFALEFVSGILNVMIIRQLFVFRTRYLKKERRLAAMQIRRPSDESVMTTV